SAPLLRLEGDWFRGKRRIAPGTSLLSDHARSESIRNALSALWRGGAKDGCRGLPAWRRGDGQGRPWSAIPLRIDGSRWFYRAGAGSAIFRRAQHGSVHHFHRPRET